MFIVEGVITVVLAVIFATFIPNKPSTVRWLTQQERDHLVYKLEADRGSKDATDEVSVASAFKMAVTDPKTWLLCGCLQVSNINQNISRGRTNDRGRLRRMHY